MKTLGDNTVSKVKMLQPGILVEEIKIKAVEDYSNYPLKRNAEKKTIGKNGFQPELCLKVTDYDNKEHYIFGKFNYKVDFVSGKKTDYLGWKKSGNGVWNLIYNLVGEFQINDDDSIPDNTLKKMLNKSFLKLRYCTGIDTLTNQPIMKDYNVFKDSTQPKAEEILLDIFTKDNYVYSKYDRSAYEMYMQIRNANATKFDPSYTPENLQSPPAEDII